MLNLKFIQENKETVIERLAVKNFDAREAVEKIIELDNLRRTLQQEAEAKQAEMNRTAKTIGQLMQSGQKEEAEQARRETAAINKDTQPSLAMLCHGQVGTWKQEEKQPKGKKKRE